MKTAPLTEVDSHLDKYVKEAADGPIVITEDGHPVAALIAITDEDDIDDLVLAYSPRLRRLLQESEERMRTEGALSSEEFWSWVDAEYVGEEKKAKG